jgi:hypothetical protein
MIIALCQFTILRLTMPGRAGSARLASRAKRGSAGEYAVELNRLIGLEMTGSVA